jgi:hypothetical protein
MKVAILSESPSDEAVLQALIPAIVGAPFERVAGPSLRSRGWPSVQGVLPVVVRHLYFQTNAEALAVLVDTDESPLHQPAHNPPAMPECRYCLLSTLIDRELRRLPTVPGRGRLKTALGVAVPSIEAWLRCGRDATVSEAAWVNGARQNHRPYTTNLLKRAAYGTDRPSLELSTRVCEEEGARLSRTIPTLLTAFPIGFGVMHGQIVGWRDSQ